MPKRSISIIFEIVILLLPAGMASAQTTYNVGGGTIVYTGPAPDVLGTTGYDVGTTAPPVDVNGVTLTQTDATHPALVIDNDTDGPLAVTFSGTPSSITGASDALNVIHFGFTETGDVSLDTSGTAGGNTFAAGDYGYGVQVDSDTGAVSNATAILGPDTISSVDGSAVDVESHTGTASLTSAANITGPTGISVFGDTAASVTLSGSVSGTQSSIERYTQVPNGHSYNRVLRPHTTSSTEPLN